MSGEILEKFVLTMGSTSGFILSLILHMTCYLGRSCKEVSVRLVKR